jgi:hypothetical protein
MLAAATEAQLQLDQIWTLEEEINIASAESEAMQRALASAELAKEAAESQASAREIVVQLVKEEALGLGKLLQRAEEEIIKLQAALDVSNAPCNGVSCIFVINKEALFCCK